MKKTLLKGLTVVTLLICLVTALVGCGGNKGGGTPSGNDKPADVTLKHPFLVDNTAPATDFLKSVLNTFTNPFEGKAGDLLTKASSNMNINGTNVVIDIQAIVNVDNNKNINLKEIYAYADATNKVNIAMYFKNNNADTDALLVHIDTDASAKKQIHFEEKIAIGNINKIGTEVNKIGKPDLSNILADLDQNLGIDLNTVIGSDLQSLFSQQISQLIARMMYDENNQPLFSEKDGKVTFNLDSTNFNNATKDFFNRANAVNNDIEANKYDVTADDKNGKDVLCNNSDMFYNKLAGLINLDYAKWAETFAVKNDNAITPFTLEMSYDKNTNGISNGIVKFNVANGTYLQYPGKDGTAAKTNTPARNITIEATNLSFTVDTISDAATQVINTDTFKNKAEIETKENAINLVNFQLTGKLQGHNTKLQTTLVKDYTYSLDVNVNPFILVTIKDTKSNDFVTILNNAFTDFNFVVKNGEAIQYQLSWEYNKGLVNKEGNIVLNIKDVANAIIKVKSSFTTRNNQPLSSYIDLGKLVGMIASGETPSMIKDANGKFTGLVDIPAGFDTKVLEIMKLSYKDLFANDINIIEDIFGLNSGITNVYVSIDPGSAKFNPERAI